MNDPTSGELATALRDLLREVRKINDVMIPDGFDARVVRNAELALAAHDAGVLASDANTVPHHTPMVGKDEQ